MVTGNPGVGKSTLARRLADALQLPVVAKDAIKERLGDVFAAPDRAASQDIGKATMLVLFEVVAELLRAGVSLITESNFSALSTEPLRAAIDAAAGEVHVVQLLVECPPGMAAERFAARKRHPVHVLTEIPALPPLPPLDLPGELLRVDSTNVPVDLTPILEAIQKRS